MQKKIFFAAIVDKIFLLYYNIPVKRFRKEDEEMEAFEDERRVSSLHLIEQNSRIRKKF
jgi:hypothetical protein